MIHVNIKLSIRQVRRLWDACEAAEAACKRAQEVGTRQPGDILSLILEDARHDYADLQARIDDALLSYDPFQREGSEVVEQSSREGGGGL